MLKQGMLVVMIVLIMIAVACGESKVIVNEEYAYLANIFTSEFGFGGVSLVGGSTRADLATDIFNWAWSSRSSRRQCGR